MIALAILLIALAALAADVAGAPPWVYLLALGVLLAVASVGVLRDTRRDRRRRQQRPGYVHPRP